MSRELDSRVAEKVMGFTKTSKGWLHPTDPALSITYLPHYSADMNDAMDIVGKLHEERWYMSIRTSPNDFYKLKLQKYLDDKAGEEIIERSQNYNKLPIAICLVALRAVGDDEWVDKFEKGQL
jgi:hypothetical protein